MVISWSSHCHNHLMVISWSWPSHSDGHDHFQITIISCSGSCHCNGHLMIMSLSLHGRLMATIMSGSPQGHSCAMDNPWSSLGPNHLMIRVVAMSWSWSQSWPSHGRGHLRLVSLMVILTAILCSCHCHGHGQATPPRS